MDVILPAAGLGTRLRPQTWSKPKPLVNVAGKTIVEHVIDSVMPANPDRIIFIAGFLSDYLVDFAKKNLALPSEFVFQTEMKGQTDAIIKARDLATNDALILFPDALFDADFSVIESRPDADVILFTKYVEDPSRLGVAVVGEDGYITKLVEKPQEPISNLALIGIYYIRSMPALYEAIDEQFERNIQTKGEYFIADAIQVMIDHGAKVISQEIPFWEDCGSGELLLSTNHILLERGETGTEQRGDSTIIHPSVVHPTAILKNATVGPFASIAAGVTIEESSITDSIVERDAVISRSSLSNSIIGIGSKVTGASGSLNIGDASVVTL